MNEKNELVVGIDLDADYTTISMLRKESTAWNAHQLKVSMVYTITNLGELIYGETAINYALIHGKNTKTMPYEYGMDKVVEENGFSYTIEELYTEFFRYLSVLTNSISKEKIASIVVSIFDEGLSVQHILRKAMTNAGIKVWSIIAKPVAAILALIINRGYADTECNILSLVLNDRQIECCSVECGDGVIDILAIEKMSLQDLKENIGPDLEKLIYRLAEISRLEFGMMFENVNIIQICTNSNELSNETKEYLKENIKKNIVYGDTSNQSSVGAMMQAAKLIGNKNTQEWLLLNAFPYSLKVLIKEKATNAVNEI